MAAIAGGAGTGGGDDPNELTQHPGPGKGLSGFVELIWNNYVYYVHNHLYN